MSKFFTMTMGLALMAACSLQTPSMDGYGDHSGLTDITIHKFDQTALTTAFGANCEKVDLKVLAEKTKLTDTGCALVDKTLNAFTLKLSTSSTAADCQLAEAEKTVGSNLGQTLNVSLKKACDYKMILWVGFMQGATGATLYQGEKSITSAELTAAPNSQLNVAIPLTLTSDGQAYGFSVATTPVNPNPDPNPNPNPNPNPAPDRAADIAQLNKILTSCGGCHSTDTGSGVTIGGLDFRVHTAQKLIEGLDKGGSEINTLIEIANSVSGDTPSMPKGGAKLDPADVAFLQKLIETK